MEEETTIREFDLSKKDKPVKPPISSFDELELVMDMITSSKSSHG
jgi:hypothetical protein